MGHGVRFSGRADYDTYIVLCRADAQRLPECQRLHLLQMACEKVAKAYLYHSRTPAQNTQASHAHIAKQLPVLLRDIYIREKGENPDGGLMKELRRLAREIELLQPAVDNNGSRPDNCEYPWDDGTGRGVVPAEYHFSSLDLPKSRGGKTLLKLLPLAISHILRTDS